MAAAEAIIAKAWRHFEVDAERTAAAALYAISLDGKTCQSGV
jgi:hypothetical protein